MDEKALDAEARAGQAFRRHRRVVDRAGSPGFLVVQQDAISVGDPSHVRLDRPERLTWYVPGIFQGDPPAPRMTT
jgi:hypothetical protein